ncbi:hypothetical protein RJ641_016804 [Dillenia turbinata]|uniref:C2 domain-containing protein n=1 Tax=Dillenia turbinata TaxID=194707 RepID=A0AAN8UX01_9MAGN
MKGGTLEVLLVSSEDVRHTHCLGKSKYYVIIVCGKQTHTSKVSSGLSSAVPSGNTKLTTMMVMDLFASGKDAEVFWNQKFTFKFKFHDWKHLTHIKLRIMEKRLLTDSFVGETIFYIGGILAEACDQGFIELKPAPYNVVLGDDTYKGQIKFGIKFISEVESTNVDKGLIL